MENSNKSNKYHTRSNSFPDRSHPTIHRAEEDLSKLRSLEASTAPREEAVCNGLVGLGELHSCLEDLLNLPLTLQALSKHQNEKSVGELLDKSVRILDVCGITREIVSQFRECVQVVQSSLRRRKGDSSIEASVNKYVSFRKKIKKDAKRIVASLNQMDQETQSSLLPDLDEHVSAVIRILRESYAVSISIFQMVLLFLSGSSSKPKTSKWSLISRLIQEGCEEQQANEIQIVDNSLINLCRKRQSKAEKIQLVNEKLESLEFSFEGSENNLEGTFRSMIRSRSTLLNIVCC